MIKFPVYASDEGIQIPQEYILVSTNAKQYTTKIHVHPGRRRYRKCPMIAATSQAFHFLQRSQYFFGYVGNLSLLRG